MQIERRRDGVSYTLEAYSWEARYLESIQQQWPGSYIQWERDGVPVRDEAGEIVSSGPAFALWRPALPATSEPVFPDLDDPALWFHEEEFEPPAEDAPEPGHTLAPTPVVPLLQQATPAPSATHSRRGGRPPREFKSTRHKSITRVDRPARNMHGYHVKITWQGQSFQKWLSDEQNGDRLGALSAAIAWRDATELRLGKPRSERMIVTRSRSSSGHVGVARVLMKGREYYRALWRDAEGRMHRRFFNIAELGERRALKAAIRARAEGEAQRLA
jgi:hypothetical protein